MPNQSPLQINADQWRPDFSLQELIPMWINKDQDPSIPINKDQFYCTKINADHCWIRGTLLDQHAVQTASDPAMICIDLYWVRLIFIDPEIWSLLIRIDLHWGLIGHVLTYVASHLYVHVHLFILFFAVPFYLSKKARSTVARKMFQSWTAS